MFRLSVQSVLQLPVQLTSIDQRLVLTYVLEITGLR